MDHEATVRRFYERLSAGDFEGFGDLMADDFVEHEETPGIEPTKGGVKGLFRMYFAAFPDMRWEVEDVLASGDRVVARVRCKGTHKAEFMGVPATGKSFDVAEIVYLAQRGYEVVLEADIEACFDNIDHVALMDRR